MNYTPNSVESTFYLKDATLQQIVTGLLVHQATRNKNVIGLLSSIKMSIPYQQVVGIEIAIADAVMNKIKASNNKCIPLNFIKGALPYYHIDNIDFLEDTSDGSSIIHALSCVAF